MRLKPPLLPSGGVAQRVTALLRAEPRRLWTPAEIAGALELPRNTVTKELSRLIEGSTDGHAPPVVRVHRGLYRAFTDAAALASVEQPPVLLHAIQAGCSLPQNRGWGPPGGEAPSWGPLAGRPVWTLDPRNGQYVRDVTWNGRLVHVAVTASTGSVQVSLRASSDPIAPDLFGAFLAWLEGAMVGWGLVWSDPWLQNVELNRDFRELYLGDVRQVRLKAWWNAWAQIYNKEGAMRAEVRWHPPRDERLTLAEAAAIIQTLSTPQTQPAVDAPALPPPDPNGMEVA